jgi:hypothetical protein
VQREKAAAGREGLADSAQQKRLARPKQEQTVVNMPGRFTVKPSQSNANKAGSDGVQ